MTCGALVVSHVGRVGDGLLVVAAVLFAARLLDPGRQLTQLMPVAGLVTRALVPVAGVGLAWLVCLAVQPLSFGDLAPAALGGLLVLALGAWIVSRFEQGVELRIAVAGTPQLASWLARELRVSQIGGYRVVGWVDSGAPDASLGVRRLGTLDDMGSIVDEQRIDLIVSGAGEQMAVAEAVAEGCLALDVRLNTINQLQERVFGQISLESLDSGFYQYLMHPRFRGGSAVAKRGIDVLVSLLGGALAAPLVALGAASAKRSGGGPVLERRRRVGAGGREFEMLKLRTTESTWAGRLAERAHVDEIPQLWNVLRGEMSLVGPRPERPRKIAQLEGGFPFYDRRELVKPGITGWAQVRHAEATPDSDFAAKLGHDFYYLKHRSTALDVMILLQTLAAPAQALSVLAPAADESLAHAS